MTIAKKRQFNCIIMLIHPFRFCKMMAISKLQLCCYLGFLIIKITNVNYYTMSNFRKLGHNF